MSFILSNISFIYKLDQALEKQVGQSEAITKRTFAVILLILVLISSQNRYNSMKTCCVLNHYSGK